MTNKDSDPKASEHNAPYHGVVMERARLLSNSPIEVDQDPANVLYYFTGTNLLNGGREPVEAELDGRYIFLPLQVPAGKRLIIDNIPKGDKYDKYPYTEDNPLVRAQVQIYHNAEGYLMADKVMAGEITKKHDAKLLPTDNPHVLEIDQDSPTPMAMDSTWPNNSRKQEYIDPAEPSNDNVFLISTTSTWVLQRPGSYDQLEIIVNTPDDAGDIVNLTLGTSNYLPEDYGPIAIRMVDDTSSGIAHNIYQ